MTDNSFDLFKEQLNKNRGEKEESLNDDKYLKKIYDYYIYIEKIYEEEGKVINSYGYEILKFNYRFSKNDLDAWVKG